MLAIRLHLCSTAQLLCLPDLSRLPHWSAAYQPRENAKCAQHTAVPHTVCPSVLRPPEGPRPSLASTAALRRPVLLCHRWCGCNHSARLHLCCCVVACLLLFLQRHAINLLRLETNYSASGLAASAPLRQHSPLNFHSPTGPPHPHIAPT